MTDWLPASARGRLGWWAFVLALAVVAAFITYSLIGMVVIGVFGYYATRPIYRRLDRAIDSDGVAAGLTISLIVVPVVVLVGYTGFQVFQHAQAVLGGGGAGSIWAFLGAGGVSDARQRLLGSLLQNPSQILTNPRQSLGTVLQLGRRILSAVVGTLLLVGIGVVLSYFLLEREQGLSAGLVELLGGEETVAYAYLSAVDKDLESVFFGNLIFVGVMSVLAILTYWGTNLLAPPELQVPLILVLGVLTGAASLIPLVVGKIVYVPLVAYLAWQAREDGGASLAFVGGVLLVYVLVLDLLPQTFVQPYITGRQLDTVMMMFGYVLGPIVFGWYGFFLLPILLVLMLEAIRIVLPELLQGKGLTPETSMGSGVGTDPREARAEGTEGAEGAPADEDAALDSD